MIKQKGFTVVELITTLFALVALAAVATGVWVLCHFIAKYW